MGQNGTCIYRYWIDNWFIVLKNLESTHSVKSYYIENRASREEHSNFMIFTSSENYDWTIFHDLAVSQLSERSAWTITNHWTTYKLYILTDNVTNGPVTGFFQKCASSAQVHSVNMVSR